MRRTHLVRTVVCAAVFSLMLGTMAFAGTVTRSAKVRGVTSYTNSYTGTYDLWDGDSKQMDNGESTSAKIARSKNSYVYNYKHNVKAYASPTGTSTTLVDNYTYTAKQYYEN